MVSNFLQVPQPRQGRIWTPGLRQAGYPLTVQSGAGLSHLSELGFARPAIPVNSPDHSPRGPETTRCPEKGPKKAQN